MIRRDRPIVLSKRRLRWTDVLRSAPLFYALVSLRICEVSRVPPAAMQEAFFFSLFIAQRFFQADIVRKQEDHRDKSQYDLGEIDDLGGHRFGQDIAVAKKGKVQGAQIKEIENSFSAMNIGGHTCKTIRVQKIKKVKVECKRQDHLGHVDGHEHQKSMMGKIAASGIVKLSEVFAPKENRLEPTDAYNHDVPKQRMLAPPLKECHRR